MRSRQDFIKDGLLLTVTMLILRTFGVLFSSRLAVTAGAAVMGTYTQIMSVYAFAVTAAAAGVNLGAMRITSESFGSGRLSDVRSGLRESFFYCFKSGVGVSILFFTLAPFFGKYLLCDVRTVSSLRALSLALPFIALSNALHGYFTGVKRIWCSALVNLLEQTLRIFATFYTLGKIDVSDPEKVCLALVVCNAASEAASFFTLFVLYLADRKRFPAPGKRSARLSAKFTGITLPVAGSSLVRSGLTTAEHIIIPIGLRASGSAENDAMAKYGTVSGMALPILLYPMALLSAFASVTISELSARVSAGESKASVRKTVTKGLSLTLIYAVGCATVIAFFSDALGTSVFHNCEAGRYLRQMAPLVIFMYLDHISDAMLKGLDKQNYVMKVNITDAALSVVFALILIPKMGVTGFIASVYVCEILNCSASFGMLIKETGGIPGVLQSILLPGVCSAASVWFYSVTERALYAFTNKNPNGNIVFSVSSVAILYVILILLTQSALKKRSLKRKRIRVRLQ